MRPGLQQMADQIEHTPITVTESPAGAMAATLSRDALLIVAVLPAFLGLFGIAETAKWVVFFRSNEFLQILGLIIVPGIVGWRQWLARRTQAKKVALARAEPGQVVIK